MCKVEGDTLSATSLPTSSQCHSISVYHDTLALHVGDRLQVQRVAVQDGRLATTLLHDLQVQAEGSAVLLLAQQFVIAQVRANGIHRRLHLGLNGGLCCDVSYSCRVRILRTSTASTLFRGLWWLELAQVCLAGAKRLSLHGSSVK